jgi:hypothetical protein
VRWLSADYCKAPQLCGVTCRLVRFTKQEGMDRWTDIQRVR